MRDVVVTYAPKEVPLGDETIRCWCDRFGTGSARRVKTARRKPGSTWHLDEMFVIRRGELYLLWRAVDEYGAERFFKRVLRSSPVPRKIITDQLRSYPVAKAEIPELANVKHVFVKAAARLNNRAENSHQPTRERERRMRGFRDPKRTQTFLSSFGPIRPGLGAGRQRLSLTRSPSLDERVTLSQWLHTEPLPIPHAPVGYD